MRALSSLASLLLLARPAPCDGTRMNPQYPTHACRMPKRQYILAVVCYLLIPAVVIASGVLFRLIDPEMARGSADYVRNYDGKNFDRRRVWNDDVHGTKLCVYECRLP